eukprot:4634070-Pyramimonas_sp.AAC.1
MITLGGRRFNSFPIKRGVRQGDPSTMTPFCLCLDPVLRWLQYNFPRQLDLALAYADDCLFGMRDSFRSLPSLWALLLCLDSAIGLALDVTKCGLLLCGGTGMEGVKQTLCEYGGGMELVHVCTDMKYLGCFIGRSASEKAWIAPLAKF